MSPRTSSRYVCQACGAVHARWSGQCTSCGQWNSIEEEIIEQLPGTPKRRQTKQSREIELHDLGGPHDPLGRIQTGLEEFDQVLGGGMVPGSAILIGGDPGIGKSTLLLQTACAIAGAHAVIYLAGEEGIDQIRLRA
ncbi:MAG: AAA family ATPase, partial [Pseudomonadota bacterium]